MLDEQTLIQKQKEELDYFYGSRTFSAMKELSQKQVKDYISIGDIAYDGSNEFKWLREYNRCKYPTIYSFSCK